MWGVLSEKELHDIDQGALRPLVRNADLLNGSLTTQKKDHFLFASGTSHKFNRNISS